jgi:hypothetical protein
MKSIYTAVAAIASSMAFGAFAQAKPPRFAQVTPDEIKWTPSPGRIPESLRPAANQVLVLDVFAKGVQVYECAVEGELFMWKLQAPQAELTDAQGRIVGKHYGGPTWEALDGSKVVGEVRASAPSTQAVAIPQLILGAKSTSGMGVFSRVRAIQRLDTHGGAAPSESCAPVSSGKTARVPYTARYFFYGDAAPVVKRVTAQY